MRKTLKPIRIGHNSLFPNKAYKSLYYKVEQWLKKNNPCKICNGKCLRGRMGGKNFCCGETGSLKACSHCGADGCKGNKPLACRLWLCFAAENALSPKQTAELKAFRKAAGVFGNETLMLRATIKDAKRIFTKKQLEGWR